MVVTRNEEGGLCFDLVEPAKPDSSSSPEDLGEWLRDMILSSIDLPFRKPKLFLYWRIVENKSSKVMKEFDYWRKADAEQLESELQAQYPGRYRLEKHKRYEYRSDFWGLG